MIIWTLTGNLVALRVLSLSSSTLATASPSVALLLITNLSRLGIAGKKRLISSNKLGLDVDPRDIRRNFIAPL